MPSGPVILNNTPLVAFWILGQLELLRSLYGEVLVPTAVLAEFVAVEAPLRQQALAQSPWIVPAALANANAALVYAGLDRGESEVLALALERGARLVVIDERKGRSFARRLDMPLTGTLGVLLAAQQRGLITDLQPSVAALQAAGLYFQPSLISRVLDLARGMG